MLRFILLLLALQGVACNRHSLRQHAKTPRSSPKTPEKAVTSNELVIEGTVISEHRHFFNRMVYTSCLVEVNTLFHGELPGNVIEIIVVGGTIGKLSTSVSHGHTYLPGMFTTAIFRLKKIDANRPDKILESLTPFSLYALADAVKPIFPSSYYDFQNRNIEKTVYQKLEAEFGRPRQPIMAPATSNKTAMAFSIEKGLPFPNRKTGLVLELISRHNAKTPDHLALTALLSGTNAAVYIQQFALDISYNPEAFGDSIVSKKRLVYELPIQRDGSAAAAGEFPPQYFAHRCVDLGPDKLRMIWVNTLSADSCWQVLPVSPGNVLANLQFAVLDKDKPVNLELSAVDSLCRQYNYATQKMTPFSYLASPEKFRGKAAGLMHPDMIQVTSDRVLKTGDTLIVTGKNFGNFADILLYGKARSGHYRYRKVPESYIVTRSDTAMTFVIPPLLLPEKSGDLSMEWFPTTGKVMVQKQWDYQDAVTYGFSQSNLPLEKTPLNSD